MSVPFLSEELKVLFLFVVFSVSLLSACASPQNGGEKISVLPPIENISVVPMLESTDAFVVMKGIQRVARGGYADPLEKLAPLLIRFITEKRTEREGGGLGPFSAFALAQVGQPALPFISSGLQKAIKTEPKNGESTVVWLLAAIGLMGGNAKEAK